MCLSCSCYGNRNFKFPFKFSKCSDTKIDPPAPQLSLVADIAHSNKFTSITTHDDICT